MNKIVKYSLYSICIALVIALASYLLAYRYFTNQIYVASLKQLELYSGTLKSKLFELRPLNRVLSAHPDIFRLLKSPDDAAQILRVNQILLKSRNIAEASEIYLMDVDGLTIAASNWQDDGGFVGNNYGFRPYFTQAIQGNSGQFYAVGIRSNIRGYYFSEPIFENRKIIGVLVLKVAIGQLENIIKDTDDKLLILDDLGIVFLSSDAAFLYSKTRILSETEIEYLTETRRFRDKVLGELRLKPLSRFYHSHVVKMQYADGADNYILAELTMPNIGWKILNLIDEKKAITTSILISIISSIVAVSIYLLLLSMHSKRKLQAEQMRFKSQQAIELERRVEERSLELKQVQDEFVQTAKLAALGQMSAAISHELSQPLTSISNYIENAKAFLKQDEYAKVEQNIGYIATLSGKMTAIIHHIKIFASKRPSEIAEVSLNKVIGETVWFMQSKFQRREVQLEMSLPKNDIFIMANSVRIEQVLMNLISNALESMQKSTVKILNIDLSFNDDLAVIKIRDTGEGLDAKAIENIFKPFYTTKDDENGMGIGLSISRSIIEEYDGILEAFNRPSGGARFEIKLPICNKIDAEE